jgi:hypothetical protein
MAQRHVFARVAAVACACIVVGPSADAAAIERPNTMPANAGRRTSSGAWYWTELAANLRSTERVGERTGCIGIGLGRFPNVPGLYVSPNGKSYVPAGSTVSVGSKYRRFLCVGYPFPNRPAKRPLVFWLRTGPRTAPPYAAYTFTLLPIDTACNTLTRPIHVG